MIKSRLAKLVLSIGLATVVAISGIFLNSNKEDAKEKIAKAEIKEEALKDIDKEENNSDESNINKEESGDVDNKDDQSNDVVNNEDNSSNEVDIEQYIPEESSVESNENSIEAQNITPPEASQEKVVVLDSSNYIGEIEQAIFQRVNRERSAAGLNTLSYNTNMEYYARIKSRDMGDNGYFEHTDLQGRLMNERIQADGITYRAWGENIAYIQGINDYSALGIRFMDNWMNSPGHKANILSSNFSSIGVGVYKIGDTYYATQEFYN